MAFQDEFWRIVSDPMLRQDIWGGDYDLGRPVDSYAELWIC